MKKLMVLIVACGLMIGCGKTGPTGPEGPQGSKGDPGVAGPGYYSVTLQPGPGDSKGKDNNVWQGGANVGSQPFLAVGYAPSVSYAIRSFMYFDVTQAGLPAGATIVDAILTLYPNGGQDAGNIISCKLAPLQKDWSELASTWTAATSILNWSTAGGDYAETAIGSFSVKVDTTAPISVHLDAGYVQNWLNGQYNYGFVIMSTPESGLNTQLTFLSRDYSTDATKRPALKIIYAKAGTLSASALRAKYQAEVLGR